MPVLIWRKNSAPLSGGSPFKAFTPNTFGAVPPPPFNPCISEAEVRVFEGLPALVTTVDGDFYTGIVWVNLVANSDTEVALYHDGCCEQTLLNFCDIQTITSPPPCAVYAPACCIGCLPTSVTLIFSSPTGTCAACAGEAVVLNMDAVNQFGVYIYESNFNPFGSCGSGDLSFIAKFECDEDYDDWTLNLYWSNEDDDIVYQAEATGFIDDCATMSSTFTISLNSNTICKGNFQVVVSTP